MQSEILTAPAEIQQKDGILAPSPLCYICGVVLTDEYGWRASDSARWYSYAAASRDCCKGCCRRLEMESVLKTAEQQKEWPSKHYGAIRAALLGRGWMPGPDMDGPGRFNFYADCGRWAVGWENGGWVLAEAPDYDHLVTRAAGETWPELLAEIAYFEVQR